MATAPNQRKVIVHREKCERDFLQIKKENWFAANKDLEPYGLQVYLYLAGNMDGFTLELSQEAAEREAGIKKTSLYYRVVVIRDPLQGLCYTVRDAVDWFAPPTARRFTKGSNHSPLPVC